MNIGYFKKFIFIDSKKRFTFAAFTCLAGLFFTVDLIARDIIPLEYKSALMLGRGHAGISTADYEDAIFYNPAGIAYGEGLYKKTILLSPFLEFSKDTRDLIREVAVEKNANSETLRGHIGQPQHVGINNFSGILFRRAALGIFANGNSNLLVSKSAKSGGLEQVSSDADFTSGLTFSLADKFFLDNLYLGMTAKYLYRGQAQIDVDLTEYDTIADKDPSEMLGFGTGTGVDLGLMWRGKGRIHWNFGLTIKNIGNTGITPTDVNATGVDDLKQTINFGSSIITEAHLSKLEVHFDLWDLTNNYSSNIYRKLHIGAGMNIYKFFGISGGLNQGYPTLGCFMDLYVFRIDIGGYSEEVGETAGLRPDRRYYFKLTGGF